MFCSISGCGGGCRPEHRRRSCCWPQPGACWGRDGGRRRCSRLGVHDDGVLHHQPLLQGGVQAQSGGGGIAAGVGDQALAPGQIALDLGDAVDSLLGHLIVGVIQMVPLLPHLRVTEADIRAKVDELLSAGQDLLRNAAHGTSVHSGKDPSRCAALPRPIPDRKITP